MYRERRFLPFFRYLYLFWHSLFSRLAAAKLLLCPCRRRRQTPGATSERLTWLSPSVEGKELFIRLASLIIFGSAR